jgi:hypothetical protein
MDVLEGVIVVCIQVGSFTVRSGVSLSLILPAGTVVTETI